MTTKPVTTAMMTSRETPEMTAATCTMRLLYHLACLLSGDFNNDVVDLNIKKSTYVIQTKLMLCTNRINGNTPT